MATPAPVSPATTEPKGIQPMSKVLEGIFPKNLGEDNAETVGKQNLARLQGTSPNPEPSPILADQKNPAPINPVDPKTPEVKDPVVEQVKEPTEAKLSDNIPSAGFDDALLGLLEPKSGTKPEVKPDAATEILSGKDPATPVVDPAIEDVIPKSAKGMQEAIVKMSKTLRDKEKLIKELQSKGSIDVAAGAVEPLRQRITELETERNQFLNQVSAVKIENHPDVQRQYIKPIQMAESFINEVAKANDGVAARELFQATGEVDRVKRHAAVRAACADLHPSDALQVEQAVDAIHDLSAGLTQIRGNATQIAANLEKQQSDQLLARQAAFRADALKAHEKTYQEFISDPLLSHFIEKDPELKKKFDTVLAAAKQAEVDTSWMNNHEVRTKAVQNALAYPLVTKVLQNQIATLIKEKKELLAQNLKLKGPGLSTQPRSTYVAPVSDKPQSTADMVKGIMASVR